MKRIFILFTVLALGLSASAQMNQHSNYIGLNVGGGLNTAILGADSASWMPRLGCVGELKYAHFFGEHGHIGEFTEIAHAILVNPFIHHLLYFI